MDKTDMILCQLLMSNSRMPYRELADRLNLSVTAVHSRIKSLLEQGVIRRFSAKVSLRALKAPIILVFGLSKSVSLQDLRRELAEQGSVYWLGVGGGNYLYIGACLREIVGLESLVSHLREKADLLEPTVGIVSRYSPGDVGPAEGRLSSLDYQIIRSLKDDSRKALSDVAEELGVSTKTVRRRLSRMMELGLVEMSIDWYPDASNDIIAILHLNLKPSIRRSDAETVLLKYWPNVFISWSFSNIPSLILSFAWSNTMKELKELCENLEQENVFQSVSPNVLYTGYVFKTWVDRLVEK
ncbi:MAG: winged helix-turn-helix transcriptional regulator [Candidatus Brockarchaeota archaeon]|nr:winged helix-turn-helix transcriptional regulator [Candidatus Brockarchaeota archaeon]